jgi:hypothetical protein
MIWSGSGVIGTAGTATVNEPTASIDGHELGHTAGTPSGESR